MSTANQFGVGFVSVLDKKDLVSYLSGKVETVPAIQAIEVIKPLTFDTIPSQEGAKKDPDAILAQGQKQPDAARNGQGQPELKNSIHEFIVAISFLKLRPLASVS